MSPSEFKEMLIRNPKFHYAMTDRLRQDAKYQVNQLNGHGKRNTFEELELCLTLFEEINRPFPEWFTWNEYDDLKKSVRQWRE